jgi:hypothetical protein
MVPFVKKAGIIKARRRWSEAEDAFHELMKSATGGTYGEYVRAWGKFLVSSTAVLHIIEGASRHTPQGRQWYGGKRRECRKDALILYMYQARNEEEHGVEPVTHIEGDIRMTVREETRFRVPDWQGKRPSSAWEVLLSPDTEWLGPKPTFSFKKPVPVLLPVTSKEGDVFQPPKEHLGQPLMRGDDPFEVAGHYLNYMERLIDEAESHS